MLYNGEAGRYPSMKHASHINVHVLVEEVDEVDVVDDVELDASVKKKIFIVTG